MERPPSDAPLLYRSRFLTACLREDREQFDRQWMQVEGALNRVIRETEQRSLVPRLVGIFLILIVLDGIALKLALASSDSTHVWVAIASSVLFGLIGMIVGFSSFLLGQHRQVHIAERRSGDPLVRSSETRLRIFRD